MFLEILTALWVSFSIGTPNVDTIKVMDFELINGLTIESKYYKADMLLLWERQNGNFYNGRIHNHDLKYFLFDEYVKTAKDINKQSYIAKFPVVTKHITFEPGLGVTTNNYSGMILGMFLKIHNKWLSLEVMGDEYSLLQTDKQKTFLTSYQYIKASIGKNFQIKKYFYIKPKFSYYLEKNSGEDMSLKIVFGLHTNFLFKDKLKTIQ